MIKAENLFSNVPEHLVDEQITPLLTSPRVRIERIVSHGQASPPGFWYDQDETEWVFLIAGSAGLLIEGESIARVLGPGDFVEIPAHVRHRVEWTDADRPTIWLAVYLKTGDAFR